MDVSELIRTDILNSSEHVIVGNKQRDLIIQTKGKIRIQYGSKLVDLFNFGDLNKNTESYSKEDVDKLIEEMKTQIIDELSKK